jgi:hypothetical protein
MREQLTRFLQAVARAENLPYTLLGGLMLVSLAARLLLICR